MNKKELQEYLRECENCFKPRIAGRALTPYECKSCNKEFRHNDTAIPLYCQGCSVEKYICRRCGSNI